MTRTAAAALASLLAVGCKSSAPPPPPALDEVFTDNFGDGVSYQNFQGSNAVLSVDTTEKHTGNASLKVTIPGATSYGGGAFPLANPRNLSGFNALTFWAKASKDVSFDVVGLGNDNTGTSLYAAERKVLPITTSWQKFVVPIPLPAKLTSETGAFHFADGGDGDYTLWLDDVKYETLPATQLGAPRPAIRTETVPRAVGGTTSVHDPRVTFDVGGSDVVVEAAPRYFTFATQDAAVATVDAAGLVTAVGEGTSDITAKLGTVDATGALTVQVAGANAPVVAAPTPPARDAADVISLFSGAYADAVTGVDWGTSWSNGNAGAHLTELTVAGNPTKKYAELGYAGVDFTGSKIDASGMTHFHVDVWTPEADKFGVKLVNIGTGATTEAIVKFNSGTSQTITTGTWISLDIPLASFAGMTFEAVGQILWLDNGDAGAGGVEGGTFFVDNVYFHK